MSLSALAQADNKTILEMDGERITLTSPAPDSVVYPDVPCRFIRRGATRDVEGMMLIGEETPLSISILELAERGITDPEAFKVKGWIVTFEGRTYRFGESIPDYSSGMVTGFLKKAGA